MKRPKIAPPTKPKSATAASVRLPPKEIAQVRLAAERSGFAARRRVLLFSGVRGGAAAEALAKELGQPLYQVDLSRVVSKYIGETERNLHDVFEAAGQGAILLFDEADALFGKRTDVKDAHDRYSNIEVNYLLQRLAALDGIVILASRSLRPLPLVLERRLWVYEFPPKPPVRKAP